MTYLIVQLQIFLLLAFALGIILGWFFKHQIAQKVEQVLRTDIAERNSRMSGLENDRLEYKERFDLLQSEHDSTEKNSQHLQVQLSETSTVVDECRAEIIELHDSLLDKEQRVTALESEARDQRRNILTLTEEAETLQGQLSDADQQLLENGNQHSDLQDQLSLEIAQLQATENELQDFQEQYSSFELKVSNKDKELRNINALLASQTAKTAAALAARDNLQQSQNANVQSTVAKSSVMQAENLALQSKVQNLESQASTLLTQVKANEAQSTDVADADVTDKNISLGAAVTAAEKMFTERPSKVDDLKRINGIGPKLETMLNKQGIYQFAQLASFTDDDVRWLDHHLAFKGRIERDDWLNQARKLLEDDG